MKYFIAHLLTGDAKRYHARIVRALKDTHRIPLPKRNSPPHITIKPPFECGLMGIVEVERELRAFARAHSAPRYTLKGFGRFGFKTMYWDMAPRSEAITFVRSLIRHLNAEVRWLPRAPLEGRKLHASIARHLDRKTAARVWRTVKQYSPEYRGSLDTVCVMKKVKDRWVVRTIIIVPRTEQLPLQHAGI